MKEKKTNSKTATECRQHELVDLRRRLAVDITEGFDEWVCMQQDKELRTKKAISVFVLSLMIFVAGFAAGAAVIHPFYSRTDKTPIVSASNNYSRHYSNVELDATVSETRILKLFSKQ